MRARLSLPLLATAVLALFCAVAVLGVASPANAFSRARQAAPDFSNADRIMNWAITYRSHPDPRALPRMVHAMQIEGMFDDDDKRGFCIGFIAGVLGTNPRGGPALIRAMFPLSAKNQGVVIKAIAYSGRPDWQTLLLKFEPRMPLRKPLINQYLNGKAPLLLQVPLTDGTPLIYSLWGYYTATGDYEPVLRVIQALRWSKTKPPPGFSWNKLVSGWTRKSYDVNKVSIGGTAKWTLASYGERDRNLITLYRAVLKHAPEDIAVPLTEVISAAQNFQSEKIRKEQFAAIQSAERRKMTADAGMSKLATAGSIGIATGCLTAGAVGAEAFAVPCVIGGALYTGVVKLMH